VGRFMLQDLLGHISKPLGRVSWLPGVLLTSAAIVLAWGYFLIQGVRDPLGGINSLWPLFGIANQLLAAVALSVATTVLVKMYRARYMWITCLPLSWLVSVTFVGAWQKIFSPVPRVGFLAQAAQLETTLTSGALNAAQAAETSTLIFNARLDAVVCGIFLVLVAAVLLDSVRVWVQILGGVREASVVEAPFVATRLRVEEL
jgi:carbon starvation protein